MSEKEFNKFLNKNKSEVDNAVQEMRKHSKDFDKKLRDILSVL